MTTQTISGTVGYVSVAPPVTTLYITTTGSVQQGVFLGIDASANYMVNNQGQVRNNQYRRGGVYFYDFHGGSATIINGSASNTKAVIDSLLSFGVYDTDGAVDNFGVIVGCDTSAPKKDAVSAYYAEAGVTMVKGNVTNGSGADTEAQIIGAAGVFLFGSGTVTNFGQILGQGTGTDGNSLKDRSGRIAAGVYSEGAGAVTNGSASDTGALIYGLFGVRLFGGGPVTNFGTIKSFSSNMGRSGVLTGGGVVTNGSASDHAALIEGYANGVGVGGGGATGTVVNYGKIENTGKGFAYGGIFVYEGGQVTNGSAADESALVEGYRGVQVNGAGTILNFGTIKSSGDDKVRGAVELYGGGILVNGAANDFNARVTGHEGVTVEAAAGTVTNFGTIEGLLTSDGKHGVLLGDGGTLTNGSTADGGAYIAGFQSGVAVNAVPGVVHNFGTIRGVDAAAGQAGVSLAAGGYVLNGAANAIGAHLIGYQGAVIGAGVGTVVNFGTVEGQGTADVRGAVALYDGGAVTNGSGGDVKALISGREGVTVEAATGTVTNFGTIEGLLTGDGLHGVFLNEGGLVANGSDADPGADIAGFQSGVAINHVAGTVRNFGTILGADAATGQAGVSLASGGLVTNGDGGDSHALIQGEAGVLSAAGVTALTNDGTIKATGGSSDYGVQLAGVSSLTNGATGLIEGYGGVRMTGAAINLGLIDGTASERNSYIGGYGLLLEGSGSTLTNGAADNAKAQVEGYVAVRMNGAGTLVNFGEIDSEGRLAVDFASTGGTLVVESGSDINGYVDGDGGTLVLGSGSGTITGFVSGDSVALAGASDATFTDFNALEVAQGATFVLADGATLAAGGDLLVEGALTLASALGGPGAFTVVAGAAVSVTTSFTDTGSWTQTGGTTTVAAGDTLTLKGGDIFAGTLTGAGAVAFTGGSDILTALTLSAAKMVILGKGVSLSGTIAIDTQVNLTGSLGIDASGATLTGGGTLVLTDSAVNVVVGADLAATLTDAGVKIEGAGQLGDTTMALVNEAAGVIDGDYADALVINTGANTIANAGLIEATANGKLIIRSVLDNTGTLSVAGSLVDSAAVTGAGVVDIDGGTADFTASFGESVAFGQSGELELAQSQGYAGVVGGFSYNGATSLDLGDIAFGAATKATYARQGSLPFGTLTITDGTHTAKITLAGDYVGSIFTVSSDGHGGTKVIDHTPAGALAPHAFIAAMAGFGAGAAGPLAATADPLAAAQQTLARP